MSEVDRRGRHEHRPPADCPVCGDRLALTRLGCGTCGTELAGLFTACEFCGLDEADRQMLRVFLASRGNLRDLQEHLGVSYPTARQRFSAMLGRLGLAEDDAPPPAAVPSREQLLAEVASGALSPAQAEVLLRSGTAPRR